ncbi:MAG: STAS domain-containing protein [Planctomycetaceae bacterium]
MIITAGSAAHFTCVEDAGAIIVTFVRQQLTDEDNLEQVGEALFALVEKDAQSRIILDLSQLDYITSSVLGKFITLHRRLHRQGGTLVLCGIQPNVRESLRASRLLDYFQTADTIDAAHAALSL